MLKSYYSLLLLNFIIIFINLILFIYLFIYLIFFPFIPQKESSEIQKDIPLISCVGKAPMHCLAQGPYCC